MAHLGVKVQKEVPVCSGNTNCTNSCPLVVRPSLACLANTFLVHQPHPHPTSFGAMLIYYPGAGLYFFIPFLTLMSLIFFPKTFLFGSDPVDEFNRSFVLTHVFIMKLLKLFESIRSLWRVLDFEASEGRGLGLVDPCLPVV